jgi:hypothetical protein
MQSLHSAKAVPFSVSSFVSISTVLPAAFATIASTTLATSV